MGKDNDIFRVLQVIGVMGRGGAESMIMNLYRNIDRNRVQFDFLVHTPKKGKFDDEIKELGGKIYTISRFNGINTFEYYRECCQFFSRHPEYKVVHGHIGSCASLYLKAAKKYGAFTVAHSHSALTQINNAHDLFYKVFSYPTRYIADQLFGCSTEAGTARYGKKAISSDKYMNFCNAIDLKRYSYDETTRENIRKRMNISEDTLVIASIGRITAQKNPSMIFSIFKEIVQNENKMICLWVGTGDEESKYREKISNEGLSDRIIMTGVRSDVQDILQGVDCFCFPSLWEGLPVSVIEAQVAGLPCVISNTISKETQVSDLVIWCDLNESPEKWAKCCVDAARSNSVKRTSPISSVRNAGYDITETANWLADFYIEHSI